MTKAELVMLRTELTNARLVVNDWHACATNDELAAWRAAQARLIHAARAVGLAEAEQLEHVKDVLFEATMRAALRAKESGRL